MSDNDNEQQIQVIGVFNEAMFIDKTWFDLLENSVEDQPIEECNEWCIKIAMYDILRRELDHYNQIMVMGYEFLTGNQYHCLTKDPLTNEVCFFSFEPHEVEYALDAIATRTCI